MACLLLDIPLHRRPNPSTSGNTAVESAFPVVPRGEAARVSQASQRPRRAKRGRGSRASARSDSGDWAELPSTGGRRSAEGVSRSSSAAGQGSRRAASPAARVKRTGAAADAARPVRRPRSLSEQQRLRRCRSLRRRCADSLSGQQRSGGPTSPSDVSPLAYHRRTPCAYHSSSDPVSHHLFVFLSHWAPPPPRSPFCLSPLGLPTLLSAAFSLTTWAATRVL